MNNNGYRIREYFSNDVASIINKYTDFQTLICSPTTKGSSHNGEDGRYIEDLLRTHIQNFLPKGLEALTGFILRAAVRTTTSNYEERTNEIDQHSRQLDIIIYDTQNYPVFQRFGNSAIVPPEGVIAIISVKKHLTTANIKKECQALLEASELCQKCYKDYNKEEETLRGPFLSIIAMDSDLSFNKIKIDHINESYNKLPYFDNIIGHIGVLKQWSIFKKRPLENNEEKLAEIVKYNHNMKDLYHIGLQLTLTGIFSVYYERRNIRRPGYTTFSTPDNIKEQLGYIPYSQLRYTKE